MTDPSTHETKADKMLEPGRCLLAVIDVQNDFCHENGAYAKMGHPVDMAAGALPGIQTALRLACDADVPRVFVRVAHSSWTDDPAWAARGAAGAVLDVARVPVAREGTWGAEFFEIDPDYEALVLTKHRYSAFVHTPLELYMRARGAETIVLAGVATNVCVHATARDALHSGFLPVVLEDATAAHSAEAHEQALVDVRSFIGRVATVADLERAWGSSEPSTSVR
jgi:ureidoacrylate peracid hydrolase